MDKDSQILCERYIDILSHKDHEDKCLRCGECCKEKMLLPNGMAKVLDKYCPAYDVRNKRCRIYNNRFYLARKLYNVQCSSVETSMANKQHPDECPYCRETDYKSSLVYR